MSRPTLPPDSLFQKVKDNWMTIAGVVLGLAALGGAYFYFKGKHTQALAHNPSPPHKRLRALAEGERGRLWPEAAPTRLEERMAQQGRLPAFDFQDARESEKTVKSNPFRSSLFAARGSLPTLRNPKQDSERARAKRAARIRS